MDFISKLEKRFGGMAISNLALYLIALQVIGVALLMGNYVAWQDLILHGSSVLDRGQWWRIFSFMMIPRTLSPIWLFFSFYIFYLMGSALEREWGAFRFNLFVWCGYLLTLGTAFVDPGAVITNVYFLGCVFLAFATLFPDFKFYLFFFIPVKVKWLGWLTAATYLLIFIVGSSGERLTIAAAFINYLLFFGNDFIHGFRLAKRRKAFQVEREEAAFEARHVCSVCGASDQSEPHTHFRYCSTCGECFCEKHMEEHKHP